MNPFLSFVSATSVIELVNFISLLFFVGYQIFTETFRSPVFVSHSPRPKEILTLFPYLDDLLPTEEV